jgi:hypothetical protein
LHPDGSALLVGEMGRVFSDSGLGNDGDLAIHSIGVGRENWNGAGDFADPSRINVGSNGFDDAGSLIAEF